MIGHVAQQNLTMQLRRRVAELEEKNRLLEEKNTLLERVVYLLVSPDSGGLKN